MNILYSGTLLAFLLIAISFWFRYKDPFHPAILLLPLFSFLYGYMPLELYLSDPDRFLVYAGGEDAVRRYQYITCGLVSALVVGILIGSRGVRPKMASWRMLRIEAPKSAFLAFALGVVGLLSWLALVMSAGGLTGAYGNAYGGGYVASGYLREMRYLGLIGIPFVYLARTGKKMRWVDWALIALCLAPTLTHAILGARRGPFFLSVIMAAGGYFYFLRKRISLPVLIGGGLATGLTMLFLVANRESIYLGSDFSSGFSDPLDFLSRWESNEYLIGNAVVQYADTHGYFYGARELTWLIGRLLPKFIWPDVWVELPQILGLNFNLGLNGGVDPDALATISSWSPSVGSAEGFTGSLYLEFGPFAPMAAGIIGWGFGAGWKSARSNLAVRVVYLIMLAFSVYLVMQSLDPWLYRLLLFGLPAYAIVSQIQSRRTNFEILPGGRVRRISPRKPLHKVPRTM